MKMVARMHKVETEAGELLHGGASVRGRGEYRDS